MSALQQERRQQRTLTDADIAALAKALTHPCECPFKEEETRSLKDLAAGAIALKKAVIWAIVVAILVAIGVKYIPGK